MICEDKGVDPDTVEADFDSDCEKHEKAFVARQKFKGICYVCGKRGHKRADCWEK